MDKLSCHESYLHPQIVSHHIIFCPPIHAWSRELQKICQEMHGPHKTSHMNYTCALCQLGHTCTLGRAPWTTLMNPRVWAACSPSHAYTSTCMGHASARATLCTSLQALHAFKAPFYVPGLHAYKYPILGFLTQVPFQWAKSRHFSQQSQSDKWSMGAYLSRLTSISSFPKVLGLEVHRSRAQSNEWLAGMPRDRPTRLIDLSFMFLVQIGFFPTELNLILWVLYIGQMGFKRARLGHRSTNPFAASSNPELKKHKKIERRKKRKDLCYFVQ